MHPVEKEHEFDDEASNGSNNSMDVDTNGMSLRTARNRERIRKMACIEHRERKAIQNMTKPLKLWLYRNKTHPYPTKADKMALASQANMTLTQVSNWFANARRRLKNTVNYPDLAWDQRIRMYNSHVSGNAELLSVHSENDITATTVAVTAAGENEYRLLEGAAVKAEREAFLLRKQCEMAADAVAREAAAASLAEVKSSLYSGYDVGPIKFKHTILQRYLNDTMKYGHSTSHYPEISGSYNTSRQRKQRQFSGSSGDETGTSDGCMSPNPAQYYHHQQQLSSTGDSSLTSPEPFYWTDCLRDTGEIQRKFTQTNYFDQSCINRAQCEGLTSEEISAVMALTHLALGRNAV